MRSRSNRQGWTTGRIAGLAAAALLAACGGERQVVEVREAATVVQCSSVGAHPKHAGASCTTCHLCRGVVAFDPASPAAIAGQPAPVFDPATKTCANVGCHGVAPGTFTYYFPDGSGELALQTVAYGSAPVATPSWLGTGTGAGCAGCHGNPPRNGAWHGGYHANQGPTGAANQCQFCHPDATSVNGVGTAITNASLHGNGQVNVQARFRSSCFGCH